jgi:subtilase family serine protease
VQNFVEWITVTPAAGSGSATISMTVSPNPGAPRSATVVIAGLSFVVNQGVPTTTTTTTAPTTSTTTTSILVLADLLPVTPSGSYCRESDGLLSVDVRNQGNASSPTSFTRVFFDNGIVGATFSDRLTTALAPATTATLTFTVPSYCYSFSGNVTCNILITADATSLVAESNEANNNATASCIFITPSFEGGRRPSP